jgi:hypothetical protein
MNKGLLPGGEQSPPNVEELQEELEALRLQNRGLKTELREANDALETARSQAVAGTKALKVLRVRLEPFHLALKFVFGELDAAGIEAETDFGRPGGVPFTERAEPGSSVHRKFAYWEAWITKLGGKSGEVIKALLSHGRMSRAQVREAIGAGWTTTDEALRKLKGLNLIEKSGDRWVLKENV